MSAYGNLTKARAGLVYGLNTEIETKIVFSGAAAQFGDAVFVDAGDEDIGYPGASTDTSLKFLGVAVISQRSFVGSEDEYPAYDSMNVLTEGQVWVTTVSGISAVANAAAYVVDLKTNGEYGNYGISTTSGIYSTAIGYFRSNVDGGLALVQLSDGLK